MKTIIFITIGLLGTGAVNAQSVDRSVLAGTGNTVVASGVQVSQTTGEMAIRYLSVPGTVTVSQGFQQGNLGTTGIRTLAGLNVNVQTFPNPFSRYIEVKTDKPLTEASFQLVDVTGKSLALHIKEQAAGRHWQIAIPGSLPSGTYWLNVLSEGYRSAYPLTCIPD